MYRLRVSDATRQLFTTPEFAVAITFGVIGLVLLIVIGMIRSRPVAAGGLVLSGAVVAALAVTVTIPLAVIAGVALLLGAAFITIHVKTLRFVAAAPGAALLAAAAGQEGSTMLVVFVFVAVVVVVPLVVSFDAAYSGKPVSLSLLVIAFLGVFITVPDTERAIVAVGAVLPLAMASPPFRVASLGRFGAYTGPAVLVWLVAVDGAARPGSLVLGVATLGILVAEPVFRVVSRASWTRVSSLLSRGFGGEVVLLGTQVVVSLIMTAVVRRSGTRFLISLGAAFVVLVVVGLWAGRRIRVDPTVDAHRPVVADS